VKIQYVPTEAVHQTWPRVEALLASAIAFSDDYTIEEVKTLVALGQWLLVVATDGPDNEIRGAATVWFFNRPGARIATITAIGGRLITNPDTFEQLKTLVRQFGATALEGAARASIARLWSQYGFTEKYRIVGVKL